MKTEAEIGRQFCEHCGAWMDVPQDHIRCADEAKQRAAGDQPPVAGAEYHGHKTFVDEHGNYRHERLTASEAEALFAQAEAETARLVAKMPTEQDAMAQMAEAYRRLRDLGWNDPCYCPKGGEVFLVIQPGAKQSGSCSYHGDWPNGSYLAHEAGDLWPCTPVLFKKIEETKP